MLGPLLFNMFLNDIFFFLKDANLGNYADNSTLYAYNKNLETVVVIYYLIGFVTTIWC